MNKRPSCEAWRVGRSAKTGGVARSAKTRGVARSAKMRGVARSAERLRLGWVGEIYYRLHSRPISDSKFF